jgi:hypothetical protein
MMRRRRMTKAEIHGENVLICVMLVIIVLLISLALYGYLSGAWESAFG